MLRFNDVTFRREPYAIGLAKGVLNHHLYARLAKTFPPLNLFKKFEERTNKWSLSEVNNKPAYKEFIVGNLLWGGFHSYVKSAAFMADVAGMLKEHKVGEPLTGKFYSRFEFSVMPADGGFLRPHTDIASKVVTLVIPMLAPGEWDTAWGGGTDVLAPKPGAVPPHDYAAGLEAFDKVGTFEFRENQAVVFYKTTTSWHSVGPIQGPAGKTRRSITVNIERVPC